MPVLSYRQRGLPLGPDAPAGPSIADLQLDLRRLGYLEGGIDGNYGPETRRAVMALQHDLLHNDGKSACGDGEAPVRMVAYNRGRVTAVDGVVDAGLVECMAEMLDDPDFPKIPASPDPAADNQRIAWQIQRLPSSRVPTAFLVAVLREVSGLAHFAVPRGTDADRFLMVRARTAENGSHAIAARSYGAGRFPLFHHPPRHEEVADVLLDPARNVEHTARELRETLDVLVAGPVERAEDRLAERGDAPASACRFPPSDPRFMRDCRNCVAAAGFRTLGPGLPLYRDSPGTWQATAAHPSASYGGVPVRERLGCDWPYAVRRLHGTGVDSFHFQVRVLKHLALL